MADVTWKLDAETSKAVRGFFKVVEAQKKSERQFRKTVTSGKLFDKTLSKMKKTAGKLAIAYLGARGLKMGIMGVIDSMRVGRQETIRFEDELTGLLSLGNNVKNIGKIKREVLGMSGAFGMSTKQIADTMFDLESGSAGLGQNIKDDLLQNTVELVKVTGTDMPVAMKALLKTYRIYGGEMMTVNDIQNKLFKTAELGFLNFQDMATFLPDVASSANVMGISLEELGASLIVATGKLGRTEKTMTGLRNVFLRMTDAEKKGIKLTGTFSEKLEQLSKIDPVKLKEIFGAEALGVISALVGDTDHFVESLKTLNNVMGDVTQEKYVERLKDMGFSFAQISKSLQQTTKNIPLTQDYAKEFGGQDLEFQLRQAGAEASIPLWAKKIPMLRDAFAIASHVVGGKDFLTKGKDILQKQADAGGGTAKQLLESGEKHFFNQKDFGGGVLGRTDIGRNIQAINETPGIFENQPTMQQIESHIIDLKKRMSATFFADKAGVDFAGEQLYKDENDFKATMRSAIRDVPNKGEIVRNTDALNKNSEKLDKLINRWYPTGGR